MTNVTNTIAAASNIRGTIVEIIMQVFTAIFLAETIDAHDAETIDVQDANAETIGRGTEEERGLGEVKSAPREPIATLKSRNLFLEDPASED